MHHIKSANMRIVYHFVGMIKVIIVLFIRLTHTFIFLILNVIVFNTLEINILILYNTVL